MMASCVGNQVSTAQQDAWLVSLPVLGIVKEPRSMDQRIQFQFRENGKMRKLTFRGRVELDSQKLLLLMLTPEGIPLLQVALHNGKIASHNYSATQWPFPPRHLIEAFTLIYWPTDPLVGLLSGRKSRLHQVDDRSRFIYRGKKLVVTIHYRGTSRWNGEACMDDHRYQLKLCSKIVD